MKPLFAAAREMQDYLERAGDRFCFIGGLALQRWGEPRFTRDVDLTLLCPLGSEGGTIDRVLAGFAARIADAREFALRNRVILIRSGHGIPIDIALGALPFEERCVERSSEFDFGDDAVLRVCSAEDLVVLKTFAGRERDWLDIESVLLRQRRALRWPLVLDELQPLLALRETPETLDSLLKLKARVEQGQ